MNATLLPTELPRQVRKKIARSATFVKKGEMGARSHFDLIEQKCVSVFFPNAVGANFVYPDGCHSGEAYTSLEDNETNLSLFRISSTVLQLLGRREGW